MPEAAYVPLGQFVQGVEGLESASVVPAAHLKFVHGPVRLAGTYMPLPQSTQGVLGLESASVVPFWHTKLLHGPYDCCGS